MTKNQLLRIRELEATVEVMLRAMEDMVQVETSQAPSIEAIKNLARVALAKKREYATW